MAGGWSHWGGSHGGPAGQRHARRVAPRARTQQAAGEGVLAEDDGGCVDKAAPGPHQVGGQHQDGPELHRQTTSRG